MSNPRDFLPAKYKKGDTSPPTNEATINDMDSNAPMDGLNNTPWSELGKKQKFSDTNIGAPTIKNNLIDEALVSTDVLPAKKNNSGVLPSKPKQKTANKLSGLLVVFFLIIGVFASFILVKQNQDSRQQASVGQCFPGEPYCVNGRCQQGYFPDGGECVFIGNSSTCGPNTHLIDGNCYHNTCRKVNGMIICGFLSDGDPCTEESQGGNWCVSPTTGENVNCSSIGMIRCQCGPNWWVIGKTENNSCNELCPGANINCSNCKPDDPEEPENTPTPTLPPESTPTPTPTPTILACAEFGCTKNSDCGTGLTCQSLTVDGQNKKICALGSNQIFCAANPNQANCCEPQAMPICANIEMLDAIGNTMSGDDDRNLEINDQVRFRCSAAGNQDVAFEYEFRMWTPNTDFWLDLTNKTNSGAKDVSAIYTIQEFGNYIVQGRICANGSCQSWETVSGAPDSDRIASFACQAKANSNITDQRTYFCQIDSDCPNDQYFCDNN